MKIGIIGINSFKDNNRFNLINDALKKDLHGLFSPNTDEIMPICRTYNKKYYSSTTELFDKTEAIYFAGSLKPNYNFAINALKNSRHLFIENISELTTEEIKHLFKVASEARTWIQLKLSKSFSSGFLNVKELISNPKLIEISKYYTSLIRNSDYNIEILNNLNLANHYFQSGIKKVSIVSTPFEVNHFSLIHIRIDYDNGAVLNMKLSNISTQEEDKAMFYEPENTFEIDFHNNFVIQHLFEKGQVVRREFSYKKEDSMKSELNDFINSCSKLNLNNIAENPPILRVIQTSKEIMDQLFKINNQQ